MRLKDTDALRLMKVEECEGHTIDYAMGWKACVDWIKTLPTVDAVIGIDELRDELYSLYFDRKLSDGALFFINQLLNEKQKKTE